MLYWEVKPVWITEAVHPFSRDNGASREFLRKRRRIQLDTSASRVAYTMIWRGRD